MTIGCAGRAAPATIAGSMETRDVRLTRFGKRLGTRSEGRDAQAFLWESLTALPEGGVLTADLTGIEVLSGSFADEAIGGVLTLLVEGDLPGRYLIVRTPTEDLVEDLDAKLSQRKLALLAVVGEGTEWRALGRIPPHLTQALAWVISNGETMSQDLVQGLGITLQNASTRLAELTRLRLVRVVQESRPMGGIQRKFHPLISFM